MGDVVGPFLCRGVILILFQRWGVIPSDSHKWNKSVRRDVFSVSLTTIILNCFLKLLTSQTCPLCPQLDSALHILSGCQHTQIRNMITERHNLACRMIFKAVSKTGSLGSCIVSKDIGSNKRMTMQKSPDSWNIWKYIVIQLVSSWFIVGTANGRHDYRRRICTRL